MHYTGDYRLLVKNNIVYLKVIGVWDEQVAQRYADDLRESVKPLVHAPWAIMGEGREWEIATPEVLDVMSEIAHWTDKNNLSNIAMLINKNQFAFLEAFRIVINNHKNTKAKLFYDNDEAVKWLVEDGFTVDLPFMASAFSV